MKQKTELKLEKVLTDRGGLGFQRLPDRGGRISARQDGFQGFPSQYSFQCFPIRAYFLLVFLITFGTCS